LKTKLTGLGLLAITNLAFAQSAPQVEMYGIFDNAVRVSTNASVSGQKYTGFTQGLFNGDRFGFRGSEAVDGGTYAIFDLEGGFVGGTGTSDQQGQLFGRQSWVGLKGAWGQLTLGRQYGNFSDMIGAGDILGLTHGDALYSNGKSNYGTNAGETNFFYQEMGLRFDNSLKYEGKTGDVGYGVMAALGGSTGDSNANSMYSGHLSYTYGPFLAGIAYQTEKDAFDKHHRNAGASARYDLGDKNMLYAFYFHSKFDANYTPINATNSEMTPGAFGRSDDILQLAANHYVTRNWNLMGIYYYDHAKGVNAVGDSGSRNGLVAVADYYFSARTDVYLAAARTKFNGALENSKNGGDVVSPDNGGPASGVVAGNFSGVSTAMIGLRHRF